MKFCQKHWDALRAEIIHLGLSDFVAKDGQEAVALMKEELEGKPATKANFDPLMSAHWMIVNNAMDMLGKIGANPLAVMFDDPDHPETQCPICYLNHLSAEHDRTCTEPDCPKIKGQTFDDWIQKAANGAAEYLKTLA